MNVKCRGFFDAGKNRTFCVAERDEHCTCKKFMPSSNGKPCAHLRPDIDNGCDCAAIQFESYLDALKKEGGET